MVVQFCNSSSQELEAGGSQIEANQSYSAGLWMQKVKPNIKKKAILLN